MEQSIGDSFQDLVIQFQNAVGSQNWSLTKQAHTLEIVTNRMAALLKDANDELFANLKVSAEKCQKRLPDLGLFDKARKTLDAVINPPTVP